MQVRKLIQTGLSFLEINKGHEVYRLWFGLMLMGIAFAYAFQPTNFAPIVFIIMPILIWIVDRAPTAKAAFVRGWFFGFGMFIKGISWVGYSFTVQDEVPQWLAPIAVVMLAAVLASFKGFAFYMAKHLSVPGMKKPVTVITSFTVAWMIGELMQGYLFTGFPWLLLGSIWAEWTVMVQGAALVGVYGLSLFTVFITAAPALFIVEKPNFYTRWTPVATTALLIVWMGFGIGRLSITEIDVVPNFKMRLVQAGVDQREKWLSYLLEEHFSNHLKLTRQDSVRGIADNIDLIIWPETAIPENMSRRTSLMRYRAAQLLDSDAHFLTGAPHIARNADGTRNIYNSLFALDENANLAARYDKFHLVPFGEYLPFENFLKSIGLSQLTGGGESFSEGVGPRTINIDGVPSFSPLICYEVIFPDRVSDWNERPKWLLNITNDAWFGKSDGPYQHLALARMRAVEEGLAMVRVAGSGISAVIDPLGRDLSSLPVGSRGIIDSALPMPLTDLPTLGMKKAYINLMILTFLLIISLNARIRKY